MGRSVLFQSRISYGDLRPRLHRPLLCQAPDMNPLSSLRQRLLYLLQRPSPFEVSKLSNRDYVATVQITSTRKTEKTSRRLHFQDGKRSMEHLWIYNVLSNHFNPLLISTSSLLKFNQFIPSRFLFKLRSSLLLHSNVSFQSFFRPTTPYVLSDPILNHGSHIRISIRRPKSPYPPVRRSVPSRSHRRTLWWLKNRECCRTTKVELGNVLDASIGNLEKI